MTCGTFGDQSLGLCTDEMHSLVIFLSISCFPMIADDLLVHDVHLLCLAHSDFQSTQGDSLGY